jgi:hypothetical protein
MKTQGFQVVGKEIRNTKGEPVKDAGNPGSESEALAVARDMAKAGSRSQIFLTGAKEESKVIESKDLLTAAQSGGQQFTDLLLEDRRQAADSAAANYTAEKQALTKRVAALTEDNRVLSDQLKALGKKAPQRAPKE